MVNRYLYREVRVKFISMIRCSYLENDIEEDESDTYAYMWIKEEKQ